MRSTISFSVTTISGVQRRPSSRGMNSIKRTTTSSSRAKRAKPSIWSSLKPRRSTQLILSGVSPAARAARMPLRTTGKLPGTRVIRSKIAASTASMLTVTRFSPAALSGPASDSSRWPLVVRARSSGSPAGVRMRASSSTSSTTPRRKSGSPPVSRTLVIPRPTKSLNQAQILFAGQVPDTVRPLRRCGNTRICSCSGR